MPTRGRSWMRRSIATRSVDAHRAVGRHEALAVLDRRPRGGDALDGADPRRPAAAHVDIGDLEVVEPVAPPTGRRRRHAPVTRRVVVVGRRPPQRELGPADSDRPDRQAVDAGLDRHRSLRRRRWHRRAAELDARRRRDPSRRRPRRGPAASRHHLDRHRVPPVAPRRPTRWVGHLDRRPRPDGRELETSAGHDPAVAGRRPARLEVVEPGEPPPVLDPQVARRASRVTDRLR